MNNKKIKDNFRSKYSASIPVAKNIDNIVVSILVKPHAEELESSKLSIKNAYKISEKEYDLELVSKFLTAENDQIKQNVFREILERYQKKSLVIAFGILKSSADAEEVVQEAFVKIYRLMSSFRGESSLYTWIYRIVFNLSIDLTRKKYRSAEVLKGDNFEFERLSFENQKEASPEKMVYENEIQKQLKNALDQISSKHRTTFILREIEGLSYDEIGKIMDCSLGTVMSRLHHARKALQTVLKDFKS